MKIGVLGGGGWGLALAGLLAENGHCVLVWEYNPAHYQLLKENHGNPTLLKGVRLPESVSYTNSFCDLAEYESDILLL
ncbi:MAG: glycerol-3-phosphate dehydrogenase, partial [Candidatus Cloacimonadaceae bacterium]